MSEPKAGPELDQRVAENVMGWETRMYPGGCRVLIPGVRGFDAGPWRPSEDIAAAWQVVEARGDCGFALKYLEMSGRWIAQFSWDGVTVDRVADTAPLAICRAALVSKEVSPT